MELNPESILDALNDFERKPTEITPILEDYLIRIAKNGEIIFPWGKLKPLLKRKLELVLDEFYESCPVEITTPVPNFENFNFDNLKKSILQAVEAFASAPFTIQRLCELVTNPKKHYNRTDKYMRGIEKNVLVVSTVEPRIGVQGDGANANINPVVNGMIGDPPHDDNDCFNGHESTDNVSSSHQLNISSNHVLLENFANVFPSAACIPSASNICINREMDETYRIRRCADLSEDEDIDLPSLSSSEVSESVEDAEIKEEAMDTAEEAHEDFSESNADKPTDVNEDSEKPDSVEEKDEKIVQAEGKVSDATPDKEEFFDANESVQHETDCSESLESVPKKEPSDTNQCQQDNTVSQSDEISQDIEKHDVSQNNLVSTNTEPSVDSETITVKEIKSEVTQNTAESNSSNQCMELEPSLAEHVP